MTRNSRRRETRTKSEMLKVTKPLCRGASDEWILAKLQSCSPLECFDAWKREQATQTPNDKVSHAPSSVAERNNEQEK